MFERKRLLNRRFGGDEGEEDQLNRPPQRPKLGDVKPFALIRSSLIQGKAKSS